MLLYIFINSKIRYRIHNPEHYLNFKKIIVTPQPAIYQNLTLNTWRPGSLYQNIGLNIASIYPINKVATTPGSYYNITQVEKYPNALGLVQQDTLVDYVANLSSPNNSNITLITAIGLEQITVILPGNSKISSWNQIKNKRIGTFDLQSGSDKSLRKILSISQSDNMVINFTEVDEVSIQNAFQTNTIDLFFCIASNPDKMITNLAKQYPIRIIGTNGIDRQTLSIIFPYSTDAKIDTSEYSISIMSTVKTLQSSVYLIANKDFPFGECYRLIKTIFNNFIYMKEKGDDIYKLQLMEFNPSYLYSTTDIIPIHPGVRKFFEDINIITYNSSPECIFKVGVEKCNVTKLNPYRLL